VVDTVSQSIRSEDASIGGVPVRNYYAGKPSTWIMVFAHGGGFSWGTLDDYDQIARNLCNATGADVMSVGYRLAPDHPFPAGLDDVCAVIREVAARKPADRKIAVGGDSAGACLAAGAAQRLHGEGGTEVEGQLLIYPMIEFHDRTPAAFHTLSDRFHPSFDAVRSAWDTYLQVPGDRLPAYAVPTRTSSLVGLPRTLTIVAENDPLCFEAMAYAEQLLSAGVPSKVISYGGTAHGFLNEAPRGIVAKALADIGAWFEASRR
jgi:acetyl esterase